jgi:DNA recombination-dependent growth factor C
MGIGSGTVNIAKYKLILPSNPSTHELVSALYKERINPLELDDKIEMVHGWCDPFKATPEFESSDLMVLDEVGKVHIAIRIDKKTIPGVSFRLQMRQALEDLTNGSKKVSKTMRDSVRARVKDLLLSKALPSVQIFSVLFDLEKQELLTDAMSMVAVEMLNALIEKTFPGAILFPISTGILGVDLEGNLDPLFDLIPCNFGGAI